MAGTGFEDRLQIAKANLAGDAVEIVRLHEFLILHNYPVPYILAGQGEESSGNWSERIGKVHKNRVDSLPADQVRICKHN